MNDHKSTLQPLRERTFRHKLDFKGEIALAIAPTAIILLVMAFVEALTQQRLLFASLASSAFLIYLDPQHSTNAVRTLILAQMMAASVGFVTHSLLGGGYLSGGVALIIAIALMIFFDAMHPPAVATSLSFALKAGNVSNLILFVWAVFITAILVGLERYALWLLTQYNQK